MYLSFCFEENFYCFTILAISLSLAPLIEAKCIRTMVKFWRENSIFIGDE